MACLVELVTEGLDLLIRDGAVLGLGDVDEFVEVVPLDLASNGRSHVSGQAGRPPRGPWRLLRCRAAW